MNSLLALVILSLNIAVSSSILQTGDACTKSNGGQGICTNFTDCQTATMEEGANGRPEICSFDRTYPVICCQADKVRVSRASKWGSGRLSMSLDGSAKSFRKCREFYPKRRVGGFGYIGGKNVTPKQFQLQFQHMARLGYGESTNIVWQCGGSLISLEFVLTAAHCLNSSHGELRYIRLGELEENSPRGKPQDFTVRELHPHPSFLPFSKYHDIALVRLDRPATLNDFVKPACLAVARSSLDDRNSATAVGWGLTSIGGSPAKILQYGELQIVPNEICKKSYGTPIRLKDGIIEDSQICADGGGKEDTCQGDSGGPLQLWNSGFLYQSFPEIVGVTSFGRECTTAPGVYTRVFHYVPWIEKIVWPNE